MENLSQFHEYVGETIMFCQCIEQDVKLIYSAMKEGNIDDNLYLIDREKWSLGKTITELQILDNSDDNPYFLNVDYVMLKEITNIRNHWAHKAYISFIYEENDINFRKQCNRLKNDHGRLKKLSIKIEQVRFDVIKRYRSI